MARKNETGDFSKDQIEQGMKALRGEGGHWSDAFPDGGVGVDFDAQFQQGHPFVRIAQDQQNELLTGAGLMRDGKVIEPDNPFEHVEG